MTIADRVKQARQNGCVATTIAYAAREGRKVTVWNCRGESVHVDFDQPSLRMVPFGRRNNFVLEPTGRYIQWGPVLYNPFDLCHCGLYHHKITHEEYAKRMVSKRRAGRLAGYEN